MRQTVDQPEYGQGPKSVLVLARPLVCAELRVGLRDGAAKAIEAAQQELGEAQDKLHFGNAQDVQKAAAEARASALKSINEAREQIQKQVEDANKILEDAKRAENGK